MIVQYENDNLLKKNIFTPNLGTDGNDDEIIVQRIDFESPPPILTNQSDLKIM